MDNYLTTAILSPTKLSVYIYSYTHLFHKHAAMQSRYSAASEIPTGYLLVMHWTDEEMSGMEEKVIAITDS